MIFGDFSYVIFALFKTVSLLLFFIFSPERTSFGPKAEF